MKNNPHSIASWFQEAKLGIFIHWGIYAVDGVAESWSFFRGEVSHEDYMAQRKGFTASKYDPEAWADLFKRAGAQYAVLTTKHHDGVALWDTQQGDLSVVKQTPAGRDLIAPWVKAIRKKGLKVGLYFSHLERSNASAVWAQGTPCPTKCLAAPLGPTSPASSGLIYLPPSWTSMPPSYRSTLKRPLRSGCRPDT